MPASTLPRSNMTSGPPLGHIIRFSLPLLAGNALQQLYNMADSVIVGQALGKTALAAVGAAGPVVFLMVSLFMGIGSGAMVLISQFRGAGESERLQTTVSTSYTALLAVAIPLSAFGFFMVTPLMHLLSVPPDAWEGARAYLMISMCGLVGCLGYNINAGILQGIGDSRTPLLFLAISCVINIVLDLVFVLVFGWGVAGASIATVIAQSLSWFFGIWYIRQRYKELKLHPLHFHFDKSIFKQMIRVGLPAGIQQALFSIANLFMSRLVNSYGSAFAAGFNGASRIDSFVLLPVQSVSIAITTFTGQNIGAGKLERVKDGTRVSMLAGFALAAIGCLLIPAGPQLMRLFSNDPEVIASGVALLNRILPFYWMMNISLVLTGVMRGAGASMVPMISGTISLWLARLPAAYLFAALFGPYNMHFCYAAGWVIGLSISIPYFLSGRWKNKGVTGAGDKRLASAPKA